MNIVIDMNLSARWEKLLQQSGFKATHWSALGPADAPDREIMAYARANHYIVLTTI